MSAERLRNSVAMMAQMAAGSYMPSRVGLVSSYDPDNYAVKVRVQPEDVESGWCPIMTGMAGAGFGFYLGPAIGDQAWVAFQEGDALVGVCIGFLPNDEDKPPSVPTGEIHVIHKAGASLIFSADGVVTLEAPAGYNVNGDTTITGAVVINGDTIMNGAHTVNGETTLNGSETVTGDVNITGAVAVVGDVAVTGAIGATGDIVDLSGGNTKTIGDLRQAYEDHKHSGVQTGGGLSGPTDTPV